MMAADALNKTSRKQVSRGSGHGRGVALRFAFSVASLLLVLPGAFAQKPIPSTTTGLRYTGKGEVVVSMVFPVMGGSRWSDTFGKTRSTGSGKQKGQDLPAPKMRPLLACFDGIWTGEGIRGDNGCYAAYGNINNDTPGTDDGLGGDEYAYAPGIWPGARVRAGQHIAYSGDSGDAEAARPHLHFELTVPNKGVINPAASLRAATILQKPLYTPPRPEVKPAGGLLRVDGEVVSVDIPRGVAMVRIAAWIKGKDRISTQTQPTERWVRLASPAVRNQLRKVEQGDFIAVVGKDPGRGQAIVAKQILPLQINKAARQLRAAVETPPTGSISRTTPSAVPISAVEPISDEPDPAAQTAPEPPRVMVLADFESGYYQGWEVFGNCWGRTPDSVSISNGTIRGWEGLYFLTTARSMPGSRNIVSGTGRARSLPIVIPPDASEIRFLIAGGNYPYRCCLNLLEGDQVVRTATGENPYKMRVVIWDVYDLRGKTVQLEVRDSMSVGVHAYVHVDDIVMLMGSTEGLPKDIVYPKVAPNPNGGGTAPIPQRLPLPATAPAPPGSFSGGGGVVNAYGGG